MMLRLTWVQPEDLIGHELRQAAQDGRDAVGDRARAGARRAARRPRSARAPPRARRPRRSAHLAVTPAGRTGGPAQPLGRADEPHRTWPDDPGAGTAASSRPARRHPARGSIRPRGCAATARLDAAWLGRAAGCLLGKPVEKLPLDGIRALARVHRQLAAGHLVHRPGRPGRTARRPPLEPPLRRHLPRREHRRHARGRRPQLPPPQPAPPPTPRQRLHHRRRGPAVARRTPRRPHLHRRARRLPQSPLRPRTPAHRPPPQPVPRMDRRR